MRLLGDAFRNLQASLNAAQAQVTHDSLPSLPADATQMTQLFQNLIGNAIKFRGEEPPQIHVGVRREPERWVFSVRDKGIGIDPQYFERIFQIFQRLHHPQDITLAPASGWRSARGLSSATAGRFGSSPSRARVRRSSSQ